MTASDSIVSSTTMSRIWLAASAALVLGVAVVDGVWVWTEPRDWQIFLQAGLLALLAVLGIFWARRARTARHRAALNAFALREIARARSGSARSIPAYRTRGVSGR
jgi:transposase